MSEPNGCLRRALHPTLKHFKHPKTSVTCGAAAYSLLEYTNPHMMLYTCRLYAC